MKSFLLAAALAVSGLSLGCQDMNKDNSTTTTNKNPNTMSTADACTHCDGVQTARADGTCPKCGMKVK